MAHSSPRWKQNIDKAMEEFEGRHHRRPQSHLSFSLPNWLPYLSFLALGVLLANLWLKNGVHHSPAQERSYDTGGRVAMLMIAEDIERYREQNGRLPDTVPGALGKVLDVSYEQLADNRFRVSIAHMGSVIVYDDNDAVLRMGGTMNERESAEPGQVTYPWLVQLCRNQKPLKSLNQEIFQGRFDEVFGRVKAFLEVSDAELVRRMCDEYGLAMAQEPSPVSPDLLDKVPSSIAHRFAIFPVAIDDIRIVVATSQPFDTEMMSVVGFLTALHVEVCLASPDDIRTWIGRYYTESPDVKSEVVIKKPENSYVKAVQQNARAPVSEDSMVVQMVSEMLLEAYELNASDIHIEPFVDGGVIRYRVDGILRKITTLPAILFGHIVQRLKSIGSMNVTNRLVPQDGSVSLELHGQNVDLRISSVPVKGGEKVVVRLLVQSSVHSIEDIGVAQQELMRFKGLMAHQSGIFVITGPTGSGKTTTLYAALKELNTFERCLVTVEDPIEYKIDGIAQIGVNRAQNVTFATALRSILRQDPDVILVGEVRDEETARITLRAALTGHFVMTTLHTNDAITAIPRLLDLGATETILADSLKGVASQRLVRKLCPDCASTTLAVRHGFSRRFRQLYPRAPIRVAIGCESCGHTGFKGRVPLLEIITIDYELADAIRANANTGDLRKLAKARGNRPIAEIARECILNGVTSADEVHRVLGEDFWIYLENELSEAR